MRRRLQQVLWNLVHNAIKFTPRQGRVDVAVTPHERVACRSVVTDTGQGIPADFLPYVFDRFRQADPSTTRGAWGLGLGLSIAKHLVELHGGTIEVESGGPGQGATFTVQLPASAAGRPRRRRADTAQLPARRTRARAREARGNAALRQRPADTPGG